MLLVDMLAIYTMLKYTLERHLHGYDVSSTIER